MNFNQDAYDLIIAVLEMVLGCCFFFFLGEGELFILDTSPDLNHKNF